MDVKEDNYRKRMNLGQDGNALVQLLVLNAVIFVVLKFVYACFLMTGASEPSFITPCFQLVCIACKSGKISLATLDPDQFYVYRSAVVPLYFQYVLAVEFWVYPAGSDRQPEINSHLPVWRNRGSPPLCTGPSYFPKYPGPYRYRQPVRGELFDCSSSRGNNRCFSGLPDFPDDQRGYPALDTYPGFSVAEFFRCSEWRYGHLSGVFRRCR